MKQIEVSIEVFAAIWSRRIPPETTEDEILKRVLGSPAIASRVPKPVIDLSGLIEDDGYRIEDSDMAKVRWVDDVRRALIRLGGRASLTEIYKEVESIRRAAGRSLPTQIEATIRRTLEDHSKDSSNFRGHDYFHMPKGKGAGVWELRDIKAALSLPKK